MFGTSIKEVRQYGRNLEMDCLEDLTYGRGLRMTSAESFQKKSDKFSKKTEKVYTGIQSSWFGSEFGDDNAYEERCS